MLSLPASRPNAYTGSPLDRASARREDPGFVAAALDDPDSLFAPVWRGRSLLRGAGAGPPPAAALLPGPAAAALRGASGAWALLGLRDGVPVFALDCSEVEDPAALAPTGCEFAELRAFAGLLPEGEAALLAHARGLMHWRVRHRHCGTCGTACAPRSAGNATHCPGCGAQHFPRTDPAVIMLVVHGDAVLLGRAARFPPGMVSTLAGFVEPGESLEEAVRREVLEEVGVAVGEVRYHSSQPWPFPSSIMLGFHAEARGRALVVDPDELEGAAWYGRDQLRDPERHGFRLPGADSIARRLIEDWLRADAAVAA